MGLKSHPGGLEKTAIMYRVAESAAVARPENTLNSLS